MDQWHYSLEQKYRERMGQIQKTWHSWWKNKIAHTISKVDDYVKHIFREHNLEADHLTNLGAEGEKKYCRQRQ